ncbi:MAG: hypothetical protein NXI07_12185, partial [bacterium]|nr:hypothetical protein [bacterium]
MHPGLIILIVIGGIGLIALVIYAAIQAEKARKQRIAEMRAYASEAGLSFREAKDTSHDDEYAHFELFRRGFDR